MKTLHKISKIIDVFVFIATTLAIAGVFYEGMTLKWYGIVGILVICMDYSFMPATIIHLIADKKKNDMVPHILHGYNFDSNCNEDSWNGLSCNYTCLMVFLYMVLIRSIKCKIVWFE